MNTPLKQADYLPVAPATPSASFGPVTMPVPGRPVDLEMRVSYPATGSDLPIILLSHGHGNTNYVASMRGYDPLVDFYAAHGFIVIQPTHLDSKTIGLDSKVSPEAPLYWRSRATDLRFILDHLDAIEAAVPGIQGRLDRNRIVTVGHSAGGMTSSMLLGLRVTDPETRKVVDMADPRIKAGVVIAPLGSGEGLSKFAYDNFPFARDVDFSHMTKPTLVIAGDQDFNPQFSARQDWRADAYRLSSGPKCLLTMIGANHSFGGISGYDVVETKDENTERVSAIQRLTWAYLRSQLYPADMSWKNVGTALQAQPEPQGRIECK